MALYPLNPGLTPLGAFDVVNTDQSSLKGGEVMSLTTASRTNTSTETSASDVTDGYDISSSSSFTRPAATIATSALNIAFLSDEGTAPEYFTLFGSIVGASAGLVSTGGTALGPHTATGTGKCTLWDKPGYYGISVNACHSTFLTSLVTGAALTPNTVIGHSNIGKLAHSTNNGAVAGTGVGYFVEFYSGSESLVTTPARLVGATVSFDRIKIAFHAGLGVRTMAANPA